MTAATYDLTIDQGATYTLGMVYRGPNVLVDDVVTQGDPIDITGCTARMQIRQSFGTPAITTSTEADDITLGTTDGRIDLVLPEAKTILLTMKKARYDFYLTFPDGTVRRLLEGKVTIDPTTTNPT